MRIKSLIGPFLSFTLLSCAEKPDCLKSTGPIIDQNIELENYNSLIIKDKIDIVLTDNEQPGAIFKGGKNLLNKIRFQNNNGVLTISNENKCNWVRDNTKPIIVELNLASLNSIRNLGFGNIASFSTLRLNKLFIEHKGEGDVSLNLEVESLEIQNFESGDVKISGKAINLNYRELSYGASDLSNLLADSVTVENLSVNHPVVNSGKYLKAIFGNKGNIRYLNSPETILVERYAFASGVLVALNK